MARYPEQLESIIHEELWHRQTARREIAQNIMRYLDGNDDDVIAVELTLKNGEHVSLHDPTQDVRRRKVMVDEELIRVMRPEAVAGNEATHVTLIKIDDVMSVDVYTREA